jgi:hypothetical protein
MERRDVLRTISGIATLRALSSGMQAQPAGVRADVHAHFLPQPYQQALTAAGLSKDRGMPLPRWTVEAHLAMMAERGISTSLLSVSSPGLDFLELAAVPRLARQINEAGAQLAHDHGGKFGFFAILEGRRTVRAASSPGERTAQGTRGRFSHCR